MLRFFLTASFISNIIEFTHLILTGLIPQRGLQITKLKRMFSIQHSKQKIIDLYSSRSYRTMLIQDLIQNT